MKKIIFFLLGLLLPILLRILIDSSLNSAGIMWPLGLTFSVVPLLVVVCLPLLVWAILANIYGYKNKPIIYSYTVGMIVGMTLAFNLDAVMSYLKYNWGLGV